MYRNKQNLLKNFIKYEQYQSNGNYKWNFRFRKLE